MKIAPSVMCADFMNLGEQIRALEASGGADALHLDIMDGHFVPGFTFGADLVQQLRKITRLPLEVHLMSDRPFENMQEFLALDIQMMWVHYEAASDLYRCLLSIRRSGVRVGVAINPGTPIEVLEEVLPEVDSVLIMTVTPGFVGLPLIERALLKAGRLTESLQEKNLGKVEVAVDGGVKIHNVEKIARMGVHSVVSGSGIFAQKDIVAAALEMKRRSKQTVEASVATW